MERVKIHEAKTNFSKLVSRVEEGEEIVIQRDDVPVAKLVPYAHQLERHAGVLKGQIWMSDDFDDPLPEFLPYM